MHEILFSLFQICIWMSLIFLEHPENRFRNQLFHEIYKKVKKDEIIIENSN